MKHFINIQRSVMFGALGALILSMLMCGTTWAAKTVCDGDNCSFYATDSDPKPTSTYNKRGNFSCVISATETKTINQSFSLILCNGYGDVYYLNMLRDRSNYQAYRGYCTYRGFSLSGCATTGEVVLLRIKGTPSMPEHISLLSTSLRWGTTMYLLNDMVHPLCSWVMAGYENWYPFDMSCSVALYISTGGFN